MNWNQVRKDKRRGDGGKRYSWELAPAKRSYYRFLATGTLAAVERYCEEHNCIALGQWNIAPEDEDNPFTVKL